MHHVPRRGVTLTEVLVAIFICGLGLMALMTLFPLGAFNMAQALEDDRCGHAAANATAILRMVWRQALQTSGPSQPGSMDPLFVQLQQELRNGPVYIDPIGIKTIGSAPVGSIPRMSLGCLGAGSLQDAYRWCALLDDIEFEPTGTPRRPIPRNLRYSWAWMLRPHTPIHADPSLNLIPCRSVSFAVVVYHNRSMMGGAGSGEYPISGSFDPNNNQVVISSSSVPIRKGTWILDASRSPAGGGYFYRVTRVEGTTLSVQPAVRSSGGGRIIVMDNVAEVFERTTLP